MPETAYFDNAATTFPKPSVVYDYADSFYRNSGGNIGRGGNALAVAAGEIAKVAKSNLKKLYGCPAGEIVFTASATDALNRILLGLNLAKDDVVYCTPFEHNAVTRPLFHLVETTGIRIEILPFDDETFVPRYEEIEEAFAAQPPRLVVMTHASNVCGAVVPVETVARMAKAYDATTVIDMSQTAGLLPLQLSSDLFDFAVFAGHKTLYGPFGIGGFICKRGAKLRPVFFGGNGINSVEQRLPENIVQMEEIGSQNTYAIAGLKASTDWLLEQGLEAIRKIEMENRDRLLECLRAAGFCSLIGEGMECERIGVVSALFDGYSPDEGEMVLGRCGVAVRSGIQCAPYAHRFLGTLPAGTIRFSVSALTGDPEFDALERALDAIAE
ncbi:MULTISPECIES: aminotransferase class V-fold PLP-dependent enzyme [Eggerthella]|uniref:aminotransferase class V-fold PLP-dependent enzyme n=1 Tax=Eggerthella TaxID=84111 RepID=UPI00136A370A|nr:MULTISPECIES: aminotransferase class V-fold PLP-dependent enzyme [Eggerthella]MDU5065370.1 aminotransferase class V-fold PLP-dependent enzyme [Eggerthella sp.]MZJ94239.1 aminotransferase class V-fold PLP-dependent enzyme [Eggerthella sp. BIOML-A3]MZK00055.1 aminotransferase class V-fold PLP-dependent enzyme [Eggerthella sp. BIOML-A1]MZK37170.1 aminotransferase class V-fold PLP-dependent enzyme [Eggerthella sp. BIOML-A5]